MKEKAEALLAARAKALGELSIPEQATLWRKRRAAAAEKAKGAARPSTQEQFRIKTDLLDASTQFAEATRRLEAGNYRGAMEYFQFATDIEPTGTHRAHLAWARYLVDPAKNAKLVLSELGGLQKQEPGCNRAWYFAGEIQRALGMYAEAEESFKRAYKTDLGDKTSQQLAIDMMRAKREQQK
jgi:tetratricopeptide (TPR) repeat protein